MRVDPAFSFVRFVVNPSDGGREPLPSSSAAPSAMALPRRRQKDIGSIGRDLRALILYATQPGLRLKRRHR
jgi:hypothetical protein